MAGEDGTLRKRMRKGYAHGKVFAKTGTTQQNNDVWLVAGTPKYVAASWFGYDRNQELTNKQTSAARNLWNKVMQELHAGLDPLAFERKGTTVEATFCYESGGIATPSCTKTGVGVYKPDHMPETCPLHGTVANPDGGTTGGTTGTTTTPTTSGTTAAP